MAEFTIKQGDTDPDLQATLIGDSGKAIDLTGATVRFHMRKRHSDSLKVDAPAVVVDEDNGIVRHEWVPADTDEAGRFEAEFEVTASNAQVITFPNDGYITVHVTREVG